jgi:hypothetical protein
MYALEMFDNKEMQAWEIKSPTNKTWDSAKTHFVAFYKSKEKFNEECFARTSGYESAHVLVATGQQPNNPPIFPSNVSSGMSPIFHQSVLEYTNSLEGALGDATEHAAALNLDNMAFLQTIKMQQKILIEQQTKFLALLSKNDVTPVTTPSAISQPMQQNTQLQTH